MEYGSFTTQSSYEMEIFTWVFELKPGICRVTGLPRNDELAGVTREKRAACRKIWGLPRTVRHPLCADLP